MGLTPAKYAALKKRFRKLGKELLDSGKPVGKAVLSTKADPKHKDDFFKDILGRSTRATANQFDDHFRSRMPGQDELVSTASVRELVFGMQDAVSSGSGHLSATDTVELNTAFNQISRLRLPTEQVGHSVRPIAGGPVLRLQHPTSAGGGDFDTRAVNHGRFDRSRAELVVERMEAESKKAGSTIASVLNVAVKTASAYTLNEGAAPPAAKNVKPHSRISTVGPAITKTKEANRTRVKDIFRRANKSTSPVLKQKRDAPWKAKGNLDAPPSPLREL